MDSSQAGIQQVIGFDNVAAAQAMVETMIERGYKKYRLFHGKNG